MTTYDRTSLDGWICPTHACNITVSCPMSPAQVYTDTDHTQTLAGMAGGTWSVACFGAVGRRSILVELLNSFITTQFLKRASCQTCHRFSFNPHSKAT